MTSKQTIDRSRPMSGSSAVRRRRPKATALSSTAPRSRLMPASTASSCCAPTPKSPPSRSFCDTAICWPWRTPSKPQRRYSPPAQSFTRPTPASAATSSAIFWLGSCARSSSTVSRPAIAGSNGSASSTILPTSVRSRSNRMAVGRCDALRSGADHRPNLPRHRPHSAAGLPGSAARRLTPKNCGA